jgi:ApaG protein
MFEAITENVRIEVQPAYVPEESQPMANYFFFSYRVRIHNQTDKTLKLLSRHWIITDAFGKVEEVEGEGVIGQQPTLKPGEMFEYSSFCPLPTPTGSMVGTYTMIDPSTKTRLEVQIPKFTLCEPAHYH